MTESCSEEVIGPSTSSFSAIGPMISGTYRVFSDVTSEESKTAWRFDEFESPVDRDINRCVRWRHEDYIVSRIKLDKLKYGENYKTKFDLIAPNTRIGNTKCGPMQKILLSRTYGLQCIFQYLSLLDIRNIMCVDWRLRNAYFEIWKNNFRFAVPKNRPSFASYLSEEHIVYGIWKTKFYVKSIDSSEDFRVCDPAFNFSHLFHPALDCVCNVSNRLRNCISLKYLQVPYEYMCVRKHILPGDIIGIKNMKLFFPDGAREYKLQRCRMYNQEVIYFNDEVHLFENGTSSLSCMHLFFLSR